MLDKLTLIRSVDARNSNHEPNMVFQTGNLEAAPRVNPKGHLYPAIGDQADRPRPDIARQWIHHLTAAIRERDKRHLITVGLVDWSLDRPGLTSGFVPEKVANDLDFVSVHLYPKKGQVNEALKTLAGFAVAKPVLIEETFPLACSAKELEEFIEASRKHAAGWIGFYWGKPPEELQRSQTISDALTLGWLELFEKKTKALEK